MDIDNFTTEAKNAVPFLFGYIMHEKQIGKCINLITLSKQHENMKSL